MSHRVQETLCWKQSKSPLPGTLCIAGLLASLVPTPVIVTMKNVPRSPALTPGVMGHQGEPYVRQAAQKQSCQHSLLPAWVPSESPPLGVLPGGSQDLSWPVLELCLGILGCLRSSALLACVSVILEPMLSTGIMFPIGPGSWCTDCCVHPPSYLVLRKQQVPVYSMFASDFLCLIRCLT